MNVEPPNPEWVIRESDERTAADQELVECARRIWPRVIGYASRQDRGRISPDDREPLATEIWECVLRSVARTRARFRDGGNGIVNLEAYLFGAFQHRFNRALRRERKRQEVVESLPPPVLASLPLIASQWKHAFDQELQIQQIVARMDEWTREAWVSRQYGYTWREIAEKHGMNAAQAKMKFRHAIEKIRQKMSGSPHGRSDTKKVEGGGL